MKRSLMVSALAVSSVLAAGFAWPADPSAARSDTKVQDQEPIFGGRMMTKEERAEYHARMHARRSVASRFRTTRQPKGPAWILEAAWVRAERGLAERGLAVAWDRVEAPDCGMGQDRIPAAIAEASRAALGEGFLSESRSAL
jgi:hypothetical protein